MFLVVMHFVHGQFHMLILQVPETIGTSLFFFTCLWLLGTLSLVCN